MTVMYNLVAVYNCKYFAIVQHSFFCLTFNTLYSLGRVFIYCLFSASVTFFTFPILSLFLLYGRVHKMRSGAVNSHTRYFSVLSSVMAEAMDEKLP